MAKRRANGDGCIRKLKDGRWQAIATVGRTPAGKLIRRKRTCISHAAARQALEDLQAEFDAKRLGNTTPTLSEFIDRWMRQEVNQKAANTAKNYRLHCDGHVKPAIGHVLMEDLTPMVVSDFAAHLQTRNVPLYTQTYVLRMLRTICNRAVKLRVIPFNPVDAVDRPKYTKKEIRPFTMEEVTKILEATKDDRFSALYILAFTTGMRIGEIFGLHWESVDFDAGTLRVDRQIIYGANSLDFTPPKTRAGIRTIELTDRALIGLQDRRKIAVSEGNAGSPLVFPTSQGNPYRPPQWSKFEWAPLLAELSIDARGFHHCRHTYATLALGEGVPVTVVSAVLGHANASVTLTQYAHMLPSQQEKSRTAMGRIIG